MKLIPNMGTLDRTIRTLIGVLLTIYAAISLNPILAIPISIITYTVATRWCLMYQFIGINTGCHIDAQQKKGRNNILEGLALSASLLLILLLIYLIVKYINL